MSVETNQQIVFSLELTSSQSNVVALKYGPELLSQLTEMAQTKQLYNAVLIDCAACGYLFPADIFIECSRAAQFLLESHGAMVFLTSDRAAILIRETLAGNLSFRMFDNHSELFDYSPSLTGHVQRALGSDRQVVQEMTDLAQQVLMSVVPVLTSLGIKTKSSIEHSSKRNALLAAVDNYSPLVNITAKLVSGGKLSEAEVVEELKGLEMSKMIYPISVKIPFLVNCFKNKQPFELKDYLVNAGLCTRAQLDEMLFELSNTPSRERLSLGPICVKKGYINSRQLEVCLHDQAFYGQRADSHKSKTQGATADESKVQSLVGHLGTTDPSNLMQNITTNRETGVLSVEYRDMQFRCLFDTGKPTHAKVSKITGDNAVIEFASSWKDGVFVFIQRNPPADLAQESCKLTKPLDKLLLDAALAQDNTNVVWKKIPKGVDSILEKLPDPDNLLESGRLVDAREDNRPLSKSEIATMQRLWNSLDGLLSLRLVVRKLADLTTYDAGCAVDRLLEYNLITVPKVDLHTPLEKFQLVVRTITGKIGVERSQAFLRLSLRDTLGFTGRARVFILGAGAEVGVDMAAARSANTSLSVVVKDLEDWQVKYIEYVSHELDRQTLLGIIRDVHATN